MYQIKTYNAIAQAGLDEFTADYQINNPEAQPDAYMIRSVDLHDHEFPKSLKVIARCGAGFNNIPHWTKPLKTARSSSTRPAAIPTPLRNWSSPR